MARLLMAGAALALLSGKWGGWGAASPHGEVLVGTATYQDYGVMDGVLEYRGSSLPPIRGLALNRSGDRGRWAWVQWADGSIDGPLLVVDCVQRDRFLLRESWGVVAEVSAELAAHRGFYGVGPVPVVVWLDEPPRARWN